MNTIRLYLAAALVLLCVAVATAHAGGDQFASKSAAADVPAAPEDGGPRNWQVTEVSGALNLREQPTTAAKIINLRLVKNCGFAILIFTSLIIHQKDGGHYILWPAYCFCA